MTPEQQVAWDAMRSAYDEATVKRMEAAEAMFSALRFAAWEYGRDMDIDAPAIFRVVDAALRAAGHGGVWVARGEEWQSVVEAHRDSRSSNPGLTHGEWPVAPCRHTEAEEQGDGSLRCRACGHRERGTAGQ